MITSRWSGRVRATNGTVNTWRAPYYRVRSHCRPPWPRRAEHARAARAADRAGRAGTAAASGVGGNGVLISYSVGLSVQSSTRVRAG